MGYPQDGPPAPRMLPPGNGPPRSGGRPHSPQVCLWLEQGLCLSPRACLDIGAGACTDPDSQPTACAPVVRRDHKPSSMMAHTRFFQPGEQTGRFSFMAQHSGFSGRRNRLATLGGVCPGESTPCSWGRTPPCTDCHPQLPTGTGCHGASMSLCESDTHRRCQRCRVSRRLQEGARARECWGEANGVRTPSVPQAAVTEPHKRGFPSSRHFSCSGSCTSDEASVWVLDGVFSLPPGPEKGLGAPRSLLMRALTPSSGLHPCEPTSSRSPRS